MAGQLSGRWKATLQDSTLDYGSTSPLKWGTGVNPIHGVPDSGGGRNTAPGGDTQTGVITPDLTDNDSPDCYGYTDDMSSVLWGYGIETGTADRPSLGEFDERNAVTPAWPEWGPYSGGVPGGDGIRSIDRGAETSYTGKQIPDENPTQGLVFKRQTDVNAPGISNPSQYVVQTSMTQLRQTRAGSQMPLGRANEYDQPIESRVPGMKMPSYSGGERHADMFPKQQDIIIRPFWNRSAGTGPLPWTKANALYESAPLQRVAPPDPYQGPQVVPADNSGAYGYSDEDVIY